MLEVVRDVQDVGEIAQIEEYRPLGGAYELVLLLRLHRSDPQYLPLRRDLESLTINSKLKDLSREIFQEKVAKLVIDPFNVN